MPWIILGAIILFVIIFGISAYNKMISLSARADNCWAQMDVQLKKRFDLIPNLVETVKGYAAHESKTLEDVTKWRSAAINAQTPQDSIAANKELSRAMVNLTATAEQYPDLKANQSFLSLQHELSELEDKIAMSRQFYNDTAMKYNEYILKVPSNIIAGMFHFFGRPYYEVDEAEKSMPRVKF